MFILGLTGGIATGKSVASSYFRELGIPVLDSDEVVHRMYAPGGAAVGPVEALFPGVVVNGAISREELSKRVLGHPEQLKQLEAVVHQLVIEQQAAFLQQAAAQGAPLAVLDIPLLFETGAEAGCDAVLCLSAPQEVQRARALQRPGMTNEKLDAILQRQLRDEQRRARADFVVDTGASGLEETRQQVGALVAALQGRPGQAFERRWRQRLAGWQQQQQQQQHGQGQEQQEGQAQQRQQQQQQQEQEATGESA